MTAGHSQIPVLPENPVNPVEVLSFYQRHQLTTINSDDVTTEFGP